MAMSDELKIATVKVLEGRLDRLNQLFQQLIKVCEEAPVIPVPRFKRFQVQPGIYLQVDSYKESCFLKIVIESVTYHIDDKNRSPAISLAEKLGYQPKRVWRACKVLESAARWLEARIAGIERARQHLLQQQSQTLEKIMQEYTLIVLSGGEQ